VIPFSNCPNLREFRVDPNSIKVNFYINHSAVLSNDTVVSVANGLNSAVTGKSIRLNKAMQMRISSVVGNVVDGLFVIDASGSISLTDFITTTKGWTIQWW
jgi:Mg-chelatase subunit ChlD